MLLNAATRSKSAAPYLSSCLIELQLTKGTRRSTRAQLRVDDLPQDPTSVVIPTARLKTLDEEPVKYGEALGKALFDGTALGTQYDEARAQLKGARTPVRFRIVLDDPALTLVRWERLYHRDGGAWVPVATGGSVPFSRFVYVNGVVRSAALQRRPARVLLVVASPNDVATYGLAPIDPAEAAAARDMFTALGGVVQVSELSSFGARRPTIQNLETAIQTGADIVHVLCHGQAASDGTMLLLEKADGTGDEVTQDKVVKALRSGAERPRLVFFAACNSALPTGRAALVSLGPALAATGIDAVLAMSDMVTFDTARTFSAHFYEKLFLHGMADRAANEARSLVHDEWDWGVPVLFSLAPEGRLLDFDPGGVGEAFLDLAGHVARVAAAGRTSVNPNDVSANVMQAVDELIKELEKSHTFLVERVATGFRKVGDDPATFQTQFTTFYNDFKSYYDNHSWRSENTHCGRVEIAGRAALPFFEAALHDEPQALAAIKQELSALGHIDADILRSMSAFLDDMNGKVEEIRALIRTDLSRAIQLKLDYEAQLSPTFKRSKDLLAELGQTANRLQAA